MTTPNKLTPIKEYSGFSDSPVLGKTACPEAVKLLGIRYVI